MELKYLRWIDKNIGQFLCWLILIRERFLNLSRTFSRKRLHENHIKKILIIKFWGFGSIVLASNAFQVVRYNFPKAYLCAFTLKQNKPVYEMLGFFDDIIDVDLNSIPSFLFNVLKSLRRIRKIGFDLAIDFEFTSRFTAIVTYLSKSNRRIGFKYKDVWRGNCFTDEVDFRENIKISQSCLNLVKPIIDESLFPILCTKLNPKLNIKKSDYEFVNELLEQENLLNKAPIVGMNVNAGELCLLRRWPKEYFVDLAKELIKKYSAHLIFTGDKQDLAYVEEVIKNIPFKDYVHNFAAKITLTQLTCLLSKVNLFITNDSGPLHLAVYVDRPTLSFFGPETPIIYGPQGKSHTVFYRKLYCSPCIRIKNYKHFNCINDYRCLREIKPSEVISEIERKRIL